MQVHETICNANKNSNFILSEFINSIYVYIYIYYITIVTLRVHTYDCTVFNRKMLEIRVINIMTYGCTMTHRSAIE